MSNELHYKRENDTAEYVFRVVRNGEEMTWEFDHKTMRKTSNDADVDIVAFDGLWDVIHTLRRWANELEPAALEMMRKVLEAQEER